jgi:non-specific serine/threonine protein kinase
MTSLASPEPAPPKTRARKRALWDRLDRRLIRSAAYALLVFVLFVLFKAAEWFLEHFLSASRNQSIVVALAIAVGLAIVFKLFHHRVERAIERWLNRGTEQRLEGLKALAAEITLIQDRPSLQQRVVERLDALLSTSGSAIYLNERLDKFSLACASAGSLPDEVTAKDPAVIHLRLQNAPTVPTTVGSQLPMPLLWPMRVHGHLIGFVAAGERRHKESFDPEEIDAVATLAQSVGTSLALIEPALAAPATAPAATGAARHNLPAHLPVLIGRERELVEVTGMLETTDLLTIVGVGGMGKTRFSLEVAAKVRERFPHGVWFIELAPRLDPGLVVFAVAEALSVREEPGRPLLATLLGFLRTRTLLIVLDNCEHLVEACARFAEAVLRDCRDVRILATSREALNIAGETVWRVPPLDTPEPTRRESSDRLLSYSAVRLFLARAKAGEPEFRMTDGNAPAIASICHRLDGIPLAIELAASRTKGLGVEQLAMRLDDRFRILTSGARTAVPRHQTLRSLIDWSHGLLNERECAMLRRVSVFTGGWTLEAAEAVCSGNGIEAAEVLELLTHLVEKSLVVLEGRRTGPRYRLLETIREYGRDKLLEAGEADRVRDRHLANFVSFVETAEPHLFAPDQARWYAMLDADLDNIRVALEWSLTESRSLLGLRLANAPIRYWVARLYWREATHWYERLLALQRGDEEHSHVRALALHYAGHVTNYHDAKLADRFNAECLRISRAQGYKDTLALGLYVRGWIHNPRLDGSATPFYEESLQLASELDFPLAGAHATAWHGMYKVAMGEYEAAKPLLHAGIEWARRLGGDASLIGRCKGNLGQAEMLQGDLAAAKAHLEESLALQKQADNRNGTAESLWLLGRLALREGDLARAIECFKESLDLYRLYASSLWVTRGLAYLMIAHEASDRLRPAARLGGALSAREERTGRIKPDLGSRAAIAEYEAAVARVREGLRSAALRSEWEAGAKLDDEAAIALALEGTIRGPTITARGGP